MNKLFFLLLLLGACAHAEAPVQVVHCGIPKPLCPVNTHYECHGDTVACGTCEPGGAHSCPPGYVLVETLCFDTSRCDL